MKVDRIKQSQIIAILMIIFITAFLGEFKFIAFSSSFRFGLGSAVFFFFLLFYKDVLSYPYIGIITGTFVTFFRIGLDFLAGDLFSLYASFQTHGPIIGYYFVFSLILYFGRAKYFLDTPFYLGVLGAFGDGMANVVELLTRSAVTDSFLLTPANLEYVVIIAVLRSFFVVGLFNMMHIKQMKAIYLEQRRRFEQVQMITSGLYVEVFYLKKLLVEIENVTAKSYDLYRNLKNFQEVPQNITSTALSIAQEVHEVKKDNQRVLAGLKKIIDQETVFIELSMSDLIELIIRANVKYAGMLKKDIAFQNEIFFDLQVTKVYPLVVILNNLVANAVEAIEELGLINITVKEIENGVEILVIDNGVGIQPGDEEVIYEPGFTTKFDESGRASTGIGLSHVWSMIKKLDGEISVLTQASKTVFKLIIPINSLTGEE